MTYSEKLRSPKWQKKRLLILERDKWTCLLCEDTETTLHIHHTAYNGNPWDAPDDELETLCEHCHLIKEYYKKNYRNLLSIDKVVKKESLGSFVIIYVYRRTEGHRVIDFFSVNRVDDEPNLKLEEIFTENNQDNFTEFVKSLSFNG